MKTLMLILTFALSAFSQNQTLTKELVEKVVTLSPKLDELNKKYPELEKATKDIRLTHQGKEIIAQLKKYKAYDDVEAIVTANGFSSVEESVGLMSRIISAMFAVQLAKIPQGFDLASVKKQQQEQLAALKNSGLPPEAMAEMEKNLKNASKSLELMHESAQEAKPLDVEFAQANFEWLVQLMQAKSAKP